MTARSTTARGLWLAAGVAACTVTSCYWTTPLQELDNGGGVGPSDGGAPDGPGFCASLLATGAEPTLCDDFDEPGALSLDWPSVSDPSPGTLRTDDTTFFSAPASLEVGVPASSQANPIVDLVRTVTVTTRLTFEFEARADVLGNSTDQVTMIAVSTPASATVPSRSLLYDVTASSAQIEEEENPSTPYLSQPYGLPAPPPIGAWVHYVIDLTLLPGGGATLGLSIGGTPVLSDDQLLLPWAPGDYEVGLGLWWLSNSRAAWGFHYDNVVITAR